MVTTFNLFTSIAWIIAGLISIINSFVFLMKNPKKRLNQLFSSGFICWSLSLFFNGMVFAIAYRSITVASIFRDLGVIIGILGVFGFILGIILLIPLLVLLPPKWNKQRECEQSDPITFQAIVPRENASNGKVFHFGSVYQEVKYNIKIPSVKIPYIEISIPQKFINFIDKN